MNVTVREIAKEAGVSAATVSLVLNQKKGVGEETRQKVQKILEKYAYKPSKTFKNQRPFELAIVKYRKHGMALEENQGFIASIIDQIEMEARNLLYNFHIFNCDEHNAVDIIKKVNETEPTGIILFGTEFLEEEMYLLEMIKSPFVVLDNSMRNRKIDSIVMDNDDIAVTAVKHLWELGHRKICFINSNRSLGNINERYEGYLKAMNAYGIKETKAVLVTPTLKGAYRDMKKLILDGEFIPSGAAVAGNDSIALGVMKALQETGYNIPKDISIVGVDDIPYSSIATPALTTVRISRSTLGSLAIDQLNKRVKHPDWPSVRIETAGNIVIRASTMKTEE